MAAGVIDVMKWCPRRKVALVCFGQEDNAFGPSRNMPSMMQAQLCGLTGLRFLEPIAQLQRNEDG